MTSGKLPTKSSCLGDELTPDQIVLLKLAIEKFVNLAEDEGVTEDELVARLHSGMDLRGLVDYIASKKMQTS